MQNLMSSFPHQIEKSINRLIEQNQDKLFLRKIFGVFHMIYGTLHRNFWPLIRILETD